MHDVQSNLWWEISGVNSDAQTNSQSSKNDTAQEKERETLEYSAATSGKLSINIRLLTSSWLRPVA